MARREIGNPLDRQNRNNHNDNYKELYDDVNQIKGTIDDLVLNSGGDSNLEVVQARGGKPTLNARLENLTSQLNDTNSQLAQKVGGGKLAEMGDLSQSVKESMTGGSVAVIGEGMVAEQNLANDLKNTLLVEATQLLTNGNFINANNWIQQNSTKTAVNNIMTLKVTSSNATIAYQSFPTISGRKYYVKARMRTRDDVTARFRVIDKLVESPPKDEWVNVSDVFTATSSNTSFLIRGEYTSNAIALDKETDISYALAVDLTSVFGAGNEPSASEYERLLSSFPFNWFDGTTNLFKARNVIIQKDVPDVMVSEQNLANDLKNTLLVEATQLISNGNFINANQWIQQDTTSTVANNVMTLTITRGNAGIVYQNFPTVAGNKYYLKVRARVHDELADNFTLNGKEFANPEGMKWLNLSNVIEASATPTQFNFQVIYKDYIIALGKEFDLSYALAVDLTETFGKGSEPTAEEFDKLLEDYPFNWFEGTTNLFKARNVIIQKDVPDVIIQPKDTIAIPERDLDFELKHFSTFPHPMSVGHDGNVYGRLNGDKANTIFRTGDSFETIEEGYDFSLESSPNGVIFATKTSTKYVVVTRNTNEQTGAIWTSSEFNSGFTKVVSITNAYPDSISISYHKGSHYSNDDVVLVGEYGHMGTKKKLHATFNGGNTWSVIKETNVIDSNVNSHFHHSIYDSYRSRIWSSQGDGVNAKLSYSDDLGNTWLDVPVPENEYGVTSYQPTLLLAFTDKLIMAPDTDDIVPAVLSIPLDTEYTHQDEESFGLEWKHSVWDGEFNFMQYGTPPYVLDGREAYLLYPNYSDKRKVFIVATGDGGKSFHNVLSLNLQPSGQLSSGLVGLDKNGKFYAYYTSPTGSPRVFVSEKVNWISEQ